MTTPVCCLCVGCTVCIGDNAHATSPQLGQGANLALVDAWKLSQALARHVGEPADGFSSFHDPAPSVRTARGEGVEVSSFVRSCLMHSSISHAHTQSPFRSAQTAGQHSPMLCVSTIPTGDGAFGFTKSIGECSTHDSSPYKRTNQTHPVLSCSLFSPPAAC